MKSKIALFATAIILNLSACSDDDEPQTQPDPDPLIPRRDIVLSNEEKTALNGMTNFSLDLLNRISAGSSDNVAISPLGLTTSMAMLTNAASGNTRTKMMEITGVESVDAMNSLHRTLLSELPGLCTRVDLKIAQSLWLDKNFACKSDFTRTASETFSAGVFSYSRGTEQARQSINKWCETHTGGTFSDVVRDNPEYDFAIISASVFNGKWAKEFKEADTSSDKFFDADGILIDRVPTMHQTISALYNETYGYQSVILPYGNEAFRMTIILPAKSSSVSNVIALLHDGELTAVRHPENGDTSVNLSLPRFTATYFSNLSGQLSEMGLADIFTSDAEFGNLTESNVYLGSFNHGMRIKTDESGTKVETITYIPGMTTAPGPSVKMTVDRPFVFLIDEVSTGAILYAGVINDPTK